MKYGRLLLQNGKLNFVIFEPTFFKSVEESIHDYFFSVGHKKFDTKLELLKI